MFVTELSFSSAILKEEQVGKGMIELFHVEDDPQIADTVKEYLEQKRDAGKGMFHIRTGQEDTGDTDSVTGASGLEYAGWGRGYSLPVDPVQLEGASGHLPYGPGRYKRYR